MITKLNLKHNFEGWQYQEAERMRSILNDAGYDADLVSIIVAYERFSEKNYAAGWYTAVGLSDELVVEALLSELSPSGGDEVYEPGEDRRESILDFVIHFKKQNNGIAPSVREIMEAVDISSTSMVNYHLERLERTGQIVFPFGPGRPRAIAVPNYEFAEA